MKKLTDEEKKKAREEALKDTEKKIPYLGQYHDILKMILVERERILFNFFINEGRNLGKKRTKKEKQEK